VLKIPVIVTTITSQEFLSQISKSGLPLWSWCLCKFRVNHLDMAVDHITDGFVISVESSWNIFTVMIWRRM